MSITYQNFCDYLITHLWKAGDTVVIDAIDTLVMTATVELDRMLRELPEREVVATITVANNMHPLPSDCRRIRSLGSPTGGELTYIAPSEFQRRNSTSGSGMWANPKYYTTVNDNIRFLGNIDPAKPVTYELWYEAFLPDFKATGTSWVADKFFDAYLYCTLKHTATFLREDERLQVWNNLYQTAVGSAIEEGAERRFSGSPLKTQFSPNIR